MRRNFGMYLSPSKKFWYHSGKCLKLLRKERMWHVDCQVGFGVSKNPTIYYDITRWFAG